MKCNSMQQTCRNVRNRCFETVHLRIPMKADDKCWMGGTGAAIKCALDSTEEARSCHCVRHCAMCHDWGTVPCAVCIVSCAMCMAPCYVPCAMCCVYSTVTCAALCHVSPAQKKQKMEFSSWDQTLPEAQRTQGIESIT